MSRHTGAFVYQGAGKNNSDSASASQRKCTSEACGIQWCLSRSNYQESRCVHMINAWKECCERANNSESEIKSKVNKSEIEKNKTNPKS